MAVGGTEGLDVLPIPLREGVGGGGGAYLAWPPPPSPLPQGEGEDILSVHCLLGPHCRHSLHNLHLDSIDP
jgi:hypothetical protein